MHLQEMWIRIHVIKAYFLAVNVVVVLCEKYFILLSQFNRATWALFIYRRGCESVFLTKQSTRRLLYMAIPQSHVVCTCQPSYMLPQKYTAVNCLEEERLCHCKRPAIILHSHMPIHCGKTQVNAQLTTDPKPFRLQHVEYNPRGLIH